ncbi:hypothetical protein ACH5AL_03125 [Actinacidiphila glaucinigra]|uniref:hypothetical protein n=1 Tax=Actinacidiphila glaucinigra TaxID=235986 RepID=UPI0037933202
MSLFIDFYGAYIDAKGDYEDLDGTLATVLRHHYLTPDFARRLAAWEEENGVDGVLRAQNVPARWTVTDNGAVGNGHEVIVTPDLRQRGNDAEDQALRAAGAVRPHRRHQHREQQLTAQPRRRVPPVPGQRPGTGGRMPYRDRVSSRSRSSGAPVPGGRPVHAGSTDCAGAS